MIKRGSSIEEAAMELMDSRTGKIPVQLDNGKTIMVEVSHTGHEDVAMKNYIQPFKDVTSALEGLISAIAVTLQKIEMDKASVKFGLELAIESGNLTAVIVKGSGKANLEITLEWNGASRGASR
jgi:hypothetical protein